MPNLNLKMKASTANAQKGIDGVKKSMTKLGRESKTTNKKMSGLFTTLRKNNNRFANISKDANRASTSVRGLGKSFNIASVALNAFMIKQAIQGLGQLSQSAMDMIETNNLFAVSFGTASEAGEEFVETMHDVVGLDMTNVRSNIGTFALLARSMGFNADQSAHLATNIGGLALDLSSLMNVPINQVMQDLRSGLLGQSETVYKYGIDVTEAALKSEALALGIEKSVRNMSQGEKMALRYNVMLRQTGIAQGDLARTLESPANQMKIFQERTVSLGRAIGSIFIPIIGRTLPYLNAFLTVITEIIEKLAILVGFDPSEGSGGTSLSENIQGVTEDVEDLGGAIKGVTLGMDELNTIQMTSGTTSNGTSGDILSEFELAAYDSLLDQVETRTSQITENMRGQFEPVLTMITEFVTKLKEMQTVAQYIFDVFLADALQGLGEGTLTNILDLVDAFVRMGSEIDLMPFLEQLTPLIESFTTMNDNLADGLIEFIDKVVTPLAEWTMEEAIPKAMEILSTAFEKIGEINFTPFTDALSKMVEPLKTIGSLALDSFDWLLNKFLLPISSWAIESLFPHVVDLLAIGLQVLADVLTVAKPIFAWLWDNFLVPLASYVGTMYLDFMEDLTESITFARDVIIDFKDQVIIWTTTLKENLRQNQLAFEEFKTKLVSKVETLVLKFIAKIAVLKMRLDNNLDNIKNAFETTINNIKDFWQGLIDKVKDAIDAVKDFFKLDSPSVTIDTSYSNPMYGGFGGYAMEARGGMNERGQLFMAGEFGKAELIGNHQGKTTVMPLENSGFVDAMYSAVYSAVSSAGGSSSGSPESIEVSIGGETFASAVVKSVNKQSRRYGGSRLEV